MDAIGYQRRKPLGCLTFVMIALGIPLLLFFGSDQVCRFDINRRLPDYPNSSLIKAKHNGIRLRALGRSEMTFKTSDDYETVAQWYRELNLEQLDKGIYNGLAAITRWAEEDPNGEGALIQYVTECGL